MHRRGEMGVSWASELESRTRLEVRFETRSHVLELGGEAGTRSDGETNRERQQLPWRFHSLPTPPLPPHLYSEPRCASEDDCTVPTHASDQYRLDTLSPSRMQHIARTRSLAILLPCQDFRVRQLPTTPLGDSSVHVLSG
jgi:hypothetical protein